MAISLCERFDIRSSRNPVVFTSGFQIRTVTSVDNLDIPPFAEDRIGRCRFGSAFTDEGHAFFQGDLERIGPTGDFNVAVAVFEIRAEPAFGCNDRNPFVLADGTGQFEQFQGLFQRDGFDELAFPQGSELAVFSLSLLDIGPEFAESGDDFLPVGSGAQFAADVYL